MDRAYRFVVVSDEHSPGQFSIDANDGLAGVSVAFIATSRFVHVTEMTDDERTRLYEAMRAGAETVARIMNGAASDA